MANKYILDTHTLVWYLEGNPSLGRRAKATMAAASSEMVLPLITLAEAAYLIEKERLGIPTVSDLLADISNDDRIEVHELTLEVFERSLTPEELRIPELHDRFIVSTGLHLQDLGHTVTILTKDKSITDAEVLPVIW
ncbi:MAG: PIN domain-containing protein [Anaerolineae bacterium]|nr:PIN domain-containing protein [Anaerolineae bacterium]